MWIVIFHFISDRTTRSSETFWGWFPKAGCKRSWFWLSLNFTSNRFLNCIHLVDKTTQHCSSEPVVAASKVAGINAIIEIELAVCGRVFRQLVGFTVCRTTKVNLRIDRMPQIQFGRWFTSRSRCSAIM